MACRQHQAAVCVISLVPRPQEHVPHCDFKGRIMANSAADSR